MYWNEQISPRTLQKRDSKWFIGKSLDGFCPMGLRLVTADELGDIIATATPGDSYAASRLTAGFTLDRHSCYRCR